MTLAVYPVLLAKRSVRLVEPMGFWKCCTDSCCKWNKMTLLLLLLLLLLVVLVFIEVERKGHKELRWK